jgi:hypothetical protein
MPSTRRGREQLTTIFIDASRTNVRVRRRC